MHDGQPPPPLAPTSPPPPQALQTGVIPTGPQPPPRVLRGPPPRRFGPPPPPGMQTIQSMIQQPQEEDTDTPLSEEELGPPLVPPFAKPRFKECHPAVAGVAGEVVEMKILVSGGDNPVTNEFIVRNVCRFLGGRELGCAARINRMWCTAVYDDALWFAAYNAEAPFHPILHGRTFRPLEAAWTRQAKNQFAEYAREHKKHSEFAQFAEGPFVSPCSDIMEFNWSWLSPMSIIAFVVLWPLKLANPTWYSWMVVFIPLMASTLWYVIMALVYAAIALTKHCCDLYYGLVLTKGFGFVGNVMEVYNGTSVTVIVLGKPKELSRRYSAWERTDRDWIMFCSGRPWAIVMHQAVTVLGVFVLCATTFVLPAALDSDNVVCTRWSLVLIGLSGLWATYAAYLYSRANMPAVPAVGLVVFGTAIGAAITVILTVCKYKLGLGVSGAVCMIPFEITLAGTVIGLNYSFIDYDTKRCDDVACGVVFGLIGLGPVVAFLVTLQLWWDQNAFSVILAFIPAWIAICITPICGSAPFWVYDDFINGS